MTDATPGPPPASRPTVVLADDYPGLISAFRRLLERSCSVVGSASSGRGAIQAAKALKPDVVVLDLTLSDLDGLEVCRQIKLAVPATRVVVVTAVEDADVKRTAMEAGASAFVVKHMAADDLEPTIHRIIKD